MLHRRERTKKREDGSEVVIGHVLVNHYRHDRTKLACLHPAGVHHVEKQRFVVVGDAGGIWRDVGAGDASPWPGKQKSTGKFHVRQCLSALLWCVAIGASCLV